MSTSQIGACTFCKVFDNKLYNGLISTHPYNIDMLFDEWSIIQFYHFAKRRPSVKAQKSQEEEWFLRLLLNTQGRESLSWSDRSIADVRCSSSPSVFPLCEILMYSSFQSYFSYCQFAEVHFHCSFISQGFSFHFSCEKKKKLKPTFIIKKQITIEKSEKTLRVPTRVC